MYPVTILFFKQNYVIFMHIKQRLKPLALALSLIFSLVATTSSAQVYSTQFSTNAQGWTLSPQQYGLAWIWYNNVGIDSMGGLRTKETPDTSRFFAASPALTLTAGLQYRVRFKTKCGTVNTRTMTVAINGQAARLGSTPVFTTPMIPLSFTEYSTVFTATATTKNVIFYGNKVGGGTYIFLHLDDVVVELANQAPTVSLTTQNASVLRGSNFTLNANAQDVDGTVTKVEFFKSGVKIGEDVSAPFSLNATALTLGNHSFTARATDNAGATTESTALTINALNTPPTVSLASSNASILRGSNFTLNATAADADDTIAKVEFFKSGVKIGEALNAPYTLSVAAQMLGNHSFTARATDSDGAIVESFTVTVLVSNVPPTVSLTTPTNNASNNNTPVRFSLNTAPTEGEQVLTTVNPLTTEDFLQLREVSFTVPTTRMYYLITAHPWTSGGYQQLKIDELRIVGEMNKAPVSRIILPTTSTVTVAENARLKMRAEATDFDGTIAKVEYYANGTKVGEATAAPYEIVWQNLPAGTYKVVSKAYDTEGVADTSKTLIVNVLQNKFSMATFLGGSSTTDDVRGSVIQTDGTIVLAANTNALPANVVSTLLNNTTAATSGTILRLSADGRTVLSATKLAQKLTDLAADAQGNLFVSAGTEGAFKLNATASQIVWQKTFAKYAHRIDAGTTGKSIVMTATETDPDDETLTGGCSSRDNRRRACH